MMSDFRGGWGSKIVGHYLWMFPNDNLCISKKQNYGTPTKKKYIIIIIIINNIYEIQILLRRDTRVNKHFLH